VFIEFVGFVGFENTNRAKGKYFLDTDKDGLRKNYKSQVSNKKLKLAQGAGRKAKGNDKSYPQLLPVVSYSFFTPHVSPLTLRPAPALFNPTNSKNPTNPINPMNPMNSATRHSSSSSFLILLIS
jgi:hypothetical protein